MEQNIDQCSMPSSRFAFNLWILCFSTKEESKIHKLKANQLIRTSIDTPYNGTGQKLLCILMEKYCEIYLKNTPLTFLQINTVIYGIVCFFIMYLYISWWHYNKAQFSKNHFTQGQYIAVHTELSLRGWLDSKVDFIAKGMTGSKYTFHWTSSS